MKLQILLPVLCLWAFGNPCIAQQSVESPKFQIGLSNYNYFDFRHNYNLQDELTLEIPMSNRVGLYGQIPLGEHWDLGLSLQYSRWQNQTVIQPHPWQMGLPGPPTWRYQESSYHLGLTDLYGRWYMQASKADLRNFVQFGLAGEYRFGGEELYPLRQSESAPSPVEARFMGFLPSLGVGMQYRLTPNWGIEASMITYWPSFESVSSFAGSSGGVSISRVGLMRFGFQLGIYRSFF